MKFECLITLLLFFSYRSELLTNSLAKIDICNSKIEIY